MQTDSELESIVLKLDQMTSELERQIDQLYQRSLVSREKILLAYNHTISSLREASREITPPPPPCEYYFMNQQHGQVHVCRVKVKRVN